ncbi:DUF1667 domain-containing protein [Pyrococcus sp. ST04]|uniref:DUF1667 domain-containing protein n=1 Tax=Pyrococcus sp. ST04 TaxID=1183377 RepID=UPI00026058B9|nr:DUF1667 domain-containing protein [Pyrococcus sp. ST04]AFK21646.1 putative molybdopterin oxidoreductase, 4Fe-4S cluster-binding subunit [Pyrococcus sp. ST04]
MTKVYRFTCIVCPLSCTIEVEMEGGKIKDIKGYTCPRGKEWAIEEVINPKRVVMSVVPVEGGKLPTVSVKTERPIPKDKIPELMSMLAKIKVKAPVKIGDVIAEFEGVKIIATREA